jgi:hypothetical protein
LTRAWDWTAAPQRNTDATRARRYPLYLEQMICTHSQLDRLFDAMQSAGSFERAIFIIHGDHGSRLDRGPHERVSEWDLTLPDMMDAYTTLFAVRLPGEVGTYDRRMLSLEQLLDHVVHRGTRRDLPDFSHGSVSTGIEELRRLVEREPTVANYLTLGLAYYGNHLYIEALEANTEALALEPEDPIAFNNLCSTHLALKN